MRTYLIAYAATALVFFGMDFTWLSLTMKSFYKTNLGTLLADNPNLVVGGLFYVFYVIGIVYFAVLPATMQGSWLQALCTGAFLGFIAYGTYDMTSWATIRDWPGIVSIVDIVWGTVATGVAATAGYFAVRYFIAP